MCCALFSITVILCFVISANLFATTCAIDPSDTQCLEPEVLCIEMVTPEVLVEHVVRLCRLVATEHAVNDHDSVESNGTLLSARSIQDAEALVHAH